MLPLGMHPSAPAVTYYTVSDNLFFLGTVALLNSLRLTGHAGELVVLDTGLTPSQRELLDEHATVFAPQMRVDVHPVVVKTYAHLSQPSGTVVVIDSDMIVTGSLSHILALAREGKICAYPDVPAVRRRWFPEWGEDAWAPLTPPSGYLRELASSRSRQTTGLTCSSAGESL